MGRFVCFGNGWRTAATPRATVGLMRLAVSLDFYSIGTLGTLGDWTVGELLLGGILLGSASI